MADRPGLLDMLGQTWPARMAKSAWEAAKLPGDVYAGRVDPLSEEGIGRAADLGGMVMGGTYAGAPRGAMGSGPVRPPALPHRSPHDDLIQLTNMALDERFPKIGQRIKNVSVTPASNGRNFIDVDFTSGEGYRLTQAETGGDPRRAISEALNRQQWFDAVSGKHIDNILEIAAKPKTKIGRQSYGDRE